MTTVYLVPAENVMAQNDGSNSQPLQLSKPVFRSQDLFQGKREIIIEHAKEYYRLLITKSGKLILNK